MTHFTLLKLLTVSLPQSGFVQRLITTIELRHNTVIRMSRQPTTVRERIKTIVLVCILLPLALPLIVVALLLFTLHRLVLYLLVWMLWVPNGKNTLLVYSDSPVWHDYMTEQVLPLVKDRAIILNWSERSTWRHWRLTQQVFYSFGGRREFNPMVIIFRPFRRAEVFRFWSAFKEWKQGHAGQVEELTNRLRTAL
jgi:hypothetical protein